jgi:glycosyltransferase involved in cell wall biosynthesis
MRFIVSMRVTHVFHHYYPVLGGMEKVAQRLAEEQVRMGHEVHLITSTLGMRSGLREETVNGVHIHRVKAIRFHYPDLAYPMECPERILKESDVVHVHSQNSLFNITLAKVAKRIDKPLVVDFVALDYLNSHANPLIRFFGGYYQERIQREAVKLVDDAITLNERDYGILKEKYGVESKVVPHGIDEEYLTKPKDGRVFREKYGVYRGNVVAYVGRVHPSKGLDTLIEAVSFVAPEVDDFIVVIAGGGSKSYREKLSRLAKKRGVERKVKLLGYISEDEKISLLDSSKVFVFPTRHFGEAYPLVVDEAYARGVPVVATEVGVLPYRVKHLETGILVPPDDRSLLAKAVVALLKDDDLLTSICRGLGSVKGSLLTWRQVCATLDNIYDGVRKLAR